MKHAIVIRLVAVLTVMMALSLTAIAQDEMPEPVVYDDSVQFPELPYASRWIEVNGSKMHYMETGDPAGTPILLLHGQPTWSYLWRDVMPHLEDSGRVIALDLIGMGLSDKPDLEYTYFDHRDYVWGFIEAMELEDIILVIHDWGSAIGFDYAFNHQDNVQGIAFMEALFTTFPSLDDPSVDAEFGAFLSVVRAGDGMGEELLINQNVFVEQILPGAIVRELSEEEMNAYRAPYPTPAERLPVFMWPNQVPIAGEPADVHEVVGAYAAWLTETELPMLMLHAEPGLIITAPIAEFIKSTYQNLEAVNVGEGRHFIQEDQPDAIGEAIADWLGRVVLAE